MGGQVGKGGDWQTPGACWPDSIAQSVSSRVSERWERKAPGCQPLHMYTCTHVHPLTSNPPKKNPNNIPSEHTPWRLGRPAVSIMNEQFRRARTMTPEGMFTPLHAAIPLLGMCPRQTHK